MAAPQSSKQNFAEGSSTRNAAFTSFDEAVSIKVTTVKENILKGWIAEKAKELALFKSTAAADTGISNLRDAIEERMGDLRSRFTYDVVGGRPLDIVHTGIQEILTGRIFQQEVLYCVAPTIIGKVNSLVHNAEDRRLQDALKRMDLSTAAPRLSSETRKNDVDALAKKVADLAKKIGGKKKVCDTLLPFILCSASILPVTRHSLADLCSDLLDAAIEEAGEGEEEWQKADHHKQVPPKENGQGFDLCKGQEDTTEEKRRQKGFWEEEWQEVGLACDVWDLFSGLSCTSSSAKQCTSCATRSFLSSFYPLSLILSLELRTLIQVCSFHFQVHVLSSCRKINIFDYTTYPPIVTYMPREISLFFLPFSAPDWLLGSQVYTRSVHTNMSISIPPEVIDPLAVGLKYIWPIGLSAEIVRSSWETLKVKAMNQWTFCTTVKASKSHHLYDYEMQQIFEIVNRTPPPGKLRHTKDEAKKIFDEEEKDTVDKFFRLHVPLMEQDLPGNLPAVPWIEETFDLGWGEIDRVLSSSPMVNRTGRPRAVDLNEALCWLKPNKVLVKPTNKNLGTALVSLDWYDDAICDFIRNNKGYQICDQAVAQSRLIKQVSQIIVVDTTQITHDLSGLQFYLVSRLPGLRCDEVTNWQVLEPEGWINDLTITIPLFNSLPKIHKTPWAIRPIVPCHSVIQQPTSQMLSIILKTFLPQFPWILVSSKHLC